MEISNKTLVWLVVTTVVVSMFGVIMATNNIREKQMLVGYYTSNDTGSASVTVSTSTVLDFAISSLNFGTGWVNTTIGANNCTLISGVSAVSKQTATWCEGFTTTGNPGLVIENDGNTFMNVTLNFSVNETSLFGASTTAAYRGLWYNFSSNETNSCRGPTNSSNSTGWVPVTIPNTSILVCTNLSWVDSTDSMFIGLKMSIPNDAEGSKSLTILAQGTNI